MSVSLAQTAIAFLIDLAEQGEIDPWDVKVIAVIDRFLNTLKTQAQPQETHGRSPYEANLSESGQAFLYASMLVLLKADTLVRAEVEAHAAALPVEELVEEEEWPEVKLPRNLERHLHRRAVAAPPKQRRVTLKELIEQLEAMAEVMTDQAPHNRARRVRPQPVRQAVRAIAQLAHQENLSEIAAALETFLDQYWDELEGDLQWLDFEALLVAWPQFQPEELKDSHHFDTAEAAYVHEKVGVFWGLLFLSAQSKVELSQEQFYRDLKVKNLKRVPLEEGDELPSFVLPD
ncbi:segregation/condensation protein A [Pseudanabaena sp. FACHB-2040]|uniref:segregation/condensation protein A n=1 Tax=Pseudanabaena sp. FACHB-2040 TaxID=2692859 RepID=UPI001688D420|nr:segregation/condensation protein A [Pseudanabaena sp. FACHB-2040]MBD0269772.1 segregation/condensation protein A [Cyanobacteria bacterium Co-bin8]MBD2257490.1 segregation/condensation protein A [Pseudanabaena sp. FACHB-2040]